MGGLPQQTGRSLTSARVCKLAPPLSEKFKFQKRHKRLEDKEARERGRHREKRKYRGRKITERRMDSSARTLAANIYAQRAKLPRARG